MLIFLFLIVTAVVTAVSARLVADVAQWWPNRIGYLSVMAVMVILAGVLTASAPKVVDELWHAKGSVYSAADRFVVALGENRKWLGVVLMVGVISAASYVLVPPSDRLEPGRLYLMSAEDLSPTDPRTTIVKQWNETHPDNQVEIVFAAGETDEQNERMVNDAKPDGDHVADVYLLDVVWMAQFVDNEYIRELDSADMKGGLDDFVDKVRRTCERNDKLWALPLNTDVGLIYRRTDVDVEEPTTWDGHSGAVAAALAAGVGREVAANAVQLAEEMRTVTLLEAIWGADGDVVDDTGTLTRTPNKSMARFNADDLEGIRKLWAAKSNPTITPADLRADDIDAGDATDLFVQGRVLYMRNWAVAHKQLTNRQQELDQAKITFKTSVPPTPSVLGGQNLAISAHTDKPRAAQALIEFLTSAQSQLILSGIGGFAPTRDSVYEQLDGEHFDHVRLALQKARPRPVIPFYTEFSRAFRNAVPTDVAEGDVRDETTRELAEIYQRRVK